MKTIIFFIFLLPVLTVAQATESAFTYKQEIRERAKRRLYEGGKDEEDLKVQTHLVNPTRKLGPDNIDEEAEDTGEGGDQHD